MFCLYYSKELEVSDLVECQTIAKLNYSDALTKYVNYCTKIIKKRITETKRFLTTICLQS